MKRPAILFLFLFSALSIKAQLGVQITATTPSASAVISTDSTGAETSGPVEFFVYRVAATVTNGVPSCPAFSKSIYTLVSPARDSGSEPVVTSSAADAAQFEDRTVVNGQAYCYGATNAYLSGGPESGAAMTAPVTVVISGSAWKPVKAKAVATP
jgi:hypothetical protein